MLERLVAFLAFLLLLMGAVTWARSDPSFAGDAVPLFAEPEPAASLRPPEPAAADADDAGEDEEKAEEAKGAAKERKEKEKGKGGKGRGRA